MRWIGLAVVAMSLCVVAPVHAQEGVANAPQLDPATAARSANPVVQDDTQSAETHDAAAPTPIVNDTAPSEPYGSEFSLGRYLLESLLGGAIGSLAAYGALVAVCGDEICLGGALAALGANVAITPLAVYGLGEMSGGDGSLSSTYYGSMLGLGAGAGAAGAGPAAGLGIGLVLMPFFGALGYELSSNARYAESHAPAIAVTASLTPLVTPEGLSGALLGARGQF